MKYSILCLGLLLMNSVAMSAPFSLQAQVIGSQGRLQPNRTTYAGSTAGLYRLGTEDIDKTVTAPGVGIHATYEVTPESRVGAEVAWVNYDEGNTRPQYQDLNGGLNASYDFYHAGTVAFYGLGGFSYHRITTEDRTQAGETTSIDDANLVNYDLGIGSRLNFAQNIRLDIGYRFSDSIQKDDVDVDTRAAGVSVRGKMDDLGLRTNGLMASMGYQF